MPSPASPLPESEAGTWPRISVVVPNYNTAAFLEETLRSILLQEYPDLELIVMDGGSTDGSVEIIRRYESWIAHWTSEPDGGQPQAINRGFSLCTGEIVAYLNSDDLYYPGTFATLARTAADHREADWLCGGCDLIDERRGVLATWAPEDPALAAAYVAKARVPQQSAFLRARLIRDFGHFDESYQFAFDHEYWARLAIAGIRPLLMADVLAAYRLHGASKTGAAINPRFIEEDIRLCEAYLRQVEPAARASTRRRIRFLRHLRVMVDTTRNCNGWAQQTAKLVAHLLTTPSATLDPAAWSAAIEATRWRRVLSLPGRRVAAAPRYP